MQQVSTLIPPQISPRVEAVDVAKGIGIIAVVLGHIPELWSPLVEVIYSFHMPLFFVLSGFLHGGAHSARCRSIGQYVSARLVPYVTFGLFCLMLTLTLRYVKRGSLESDVVLLGLGSFLAGKPVRGMELWFYPCLLAVELIGAAVLRKQGTLIRWSGCVVIAAIGLVLARWNSVIPWSLDVALVALPFWLFGAEARDLSSRHEHFARPFHWLIVLPVAIAIIYYHIFHLSLRVNMRDGLYGNIVLFYGGALGGIFVILLISTLLRRSRVLAFIGRASFVIYPTHAIIILLVNVAIFQVAPGAGSSGSGFLLRFVCAMVGGGMIYVLATRSPTLSFYFTGRRRCTR